MYKFYCNDYSKNYGRLYLYIEDVLLRHKVNLLLDHNIWYPKHPFCVERYNQATDVWWADLIDDIRKPTIEWSDKIAAMVRSEDTNTCRLGYDLLRKVSTKKYYKEILNTLSLQE